MMSIIIETFMNPGEPSHETVRVRPIPGQFKEDYRVWCSTSQRKIAPVGSLFQVNATWVIAAGRKTQLKVDLHSRWVPISQENARIIIAKIGPSKICPPAEI
jgi:hypothetical protein